MAILLRCIEIMEQTEGSNLNGASLVHTLLGVPLIVEQIEELSTKLPDGRSRTEIIESKIYRDHAGRFRIETASTTSPVLSQLSETVLLADPVEKSITLLVPSAKIAHRMIQGKDDPSCGLAFAVAGIPMPGKDRKIEKIGKRTIEGIDCEGARMTVTSDDRPDVLKVEERWISNELGLTLLVEATSLTMHYSARIRKVLQKDPDPDLFVVPPDFTIHNLEDDGREHPLK